MIKPTKAVFPVAGLGTRFLPATKANPKEMLSIVDKPLIQYAAEEAVAAGITELIFVTNHSKRAIEDHFDSNFELETRLSIRDQQGCLAIVQDILPKGVNCAYIRQKEPRGLGHAILCAESLVGDQPFVVLLADDLIYAKRQSCMAQMMALYENKQQTIIGVERIEPSDSRKYGIVDVRHTENPYQTIQGIVEKPAPEDAPSNLGVVGRYILNPAIFKHLKNTLGDRRGEVQLTDAIAKLLHEESVCAFEFQGTRYDCGSKLGYLKATVAFGMRHPEVGEKFKCYLEALETLEVCV